VTLERAFGLAVGLAVAAQAQIIDFESGGLKYKAMTHGGVTIMFSVLPTHIRDYAILQVAISNGSPVSWTVKPEDFGFYVTPRTTWDRLTDAWRKKLAR